MKQKWISLLALVLCAALLLPSVVMAREVTPEDFLEMTEDAQEQYLENSGMSYEEAAGFSTDGGGWMTDHDYVQCAACGGWYMSGNEFRNHICSGSNSDYYVQCEACGGWYMSGNEFRNHFCTGRPSNPSSSWTSEDDYYNALVEGQLNPDTTTAIGTLYVNTANGKGLNMRSRPNTNGQILTTIPNGSAVTLFWYENSSWAYVAYRSYFGFCMTRHLSEYPGSNNHSSGSSSSSHNSATVASGSDTNLNQMFKGFKYVNYTAAVKPSSPTGFVNMRWAPSKTAPVQCIYYADTVLNVIATNGTWSQVYNELTGQGGFIMNAFLNKYLD